MVVYRFNIHTDTHIHIFHVFFVPYDNLCIPISFTAGHIIFVLYDFSHIFYYAYTTIHLTPNIPSLIPYQFTFFSFLFSTKNTFRTRCSPFHHLPYHTTLNSILLAFKRPIRAEKNMRSKIIVRIRHSVYKKAVQKITFLLHFLLSFFILTVCHPNISIFEEEKGRKKKEFQCEKYEPSSFSITFLS